MLSRDLRVERLARHGILVPMRTPAEVTARLAAIQAQDLTAALWAVGLRVSSAAAADVTGTIAHRTIVRTWLLRGTLHFTTAEDVRWILGLVGPRIIAMHAGRHRQLGLGPDDFSRCRRLFADVLGGGTALNRAEMFGLLDKAGISPAGQRGYHLLAVAGLSGQICFGEPRGKEQTFVLLEDWVPVSSELSDRDARSRLAERYFAGHGPATLRDFVWWSGLAASAAREGIRAAGSRLMVLKGAGREVYTTPGIQEPYANEIPAVLLPGFDEYIIGYRERDIFCTPDTVSEFPRGTGMIPPAFILDGCVSGTWKRFRGKDGFSLTVQPLRELGDSDRRKIRDSAERFGRFLGSRVSVSF